ncbi:MAG: hypothetical protein MJE12_14500 [Alphaproteobacteria bacterium]|nr:hypothetical protein [Alphaproteobacteria bacterium]
MADMENHPMKRVASDPECGLAHEGPDNVIDLSDHFPRKPARSTAADDPYGKIAYQRRLAVKRIDSAIERLVGQHGAHRPAAEEGVATLKCARQILQNLEIGAPDFQDRLNRLAIQLGHLSERLWRVAEAQGATRRNTAPSTDPAE